LLKDWRRLNVALTRSKNKLIMIGSATTLSSLNLYGKMLQMLVEKNAIIEVPRDQVFVNHQKTTTRKGTSKTIADAEHVAKKILNNNPTLANIVTE
jgi:DNA replication ATP-dependent helicase Dna2